jgi:solute carrier family 25 (mitochondrial citrate transporter), member 1
MHSYVTQPLDTVKTRMQSIEARKNYRNSFVCAASIFKNEGVLTLWSGAVPRLARLILSGGIVFTMYVLPLPLQNQTEPRLERSTDECRLQVREGDGGDGSI